MIADKRTELYLQKRRKLINAAMQKYLPPAKTFPSAIHQAMRYAVFSGGKRLRPILTLAACEAVHGKTKDALAAACAVECVHAYSLVHDDLPFCDDDDFRRGKPTVHRRFDPAIALLAGDALLTFGFELLAESSVSPKAAIKAISILADAIGANGMIAGQVIDLANKDKEPDLPTLQYIVTHKTGALIAAALTIGAVYGGAAKRMRNSLSLYGEYLGAAFQIIDDVIDEDGYARIFGVDSAREQASRFTANAKSQLRDFGKAAAPLLGIADYVLDRKK